LQSQISKPNSNTFFVKPFASYLVEVHAIALEVKYGTVGVGDKPIYITIELRTKSKTLDTVTLVSNGPLIRQEDDKTIIDAELLANGSANAYRASMARYPRGSALIKASGRLIPICPINIRTAIFLMILSPGA
jgi:hypothetical protein